MREATQAQTLRVQVYQKLRTALRKGPLGSGATVTERDVAEQFGVSRTPVREALMLLAHEGLVAATTRGFSAPQLAERDITDLYEIRRMLEPGALASTVDHLSTHDFRTLRQLLADQVAADAAGDVDTFATANANFRAVWLGVVPNSQLRALIARHDDHVRWLRQATLHDPKVRKTVIGGLRNILSALQGGKRAAVVAAMLAHLVEAERALTARL